MLFKLSPQTRRRCRPQAFVTSLQLPISRSQPFPASISAKRAKPFDALATSSAIPLTNRVTVSLPKPLGVSLTEVVRNGQNRVVVTSVRRDSAANGIVHIGDVVASVGGTPAQSLTGAVQNILESVPQHNITLVLERAENQSNSSDVDDQHTLASSHLHSSDVPSIGVYAEQDAHLTDLISSYVTNRKVDEFFAAPDLEAVLNAAEDLVKQRAKLSMKSSQLIFSVLYSLKRASVPLTNRFYNITMSSLIKCGHAAQAIDVFEEIDSPSLECYTTLAKAYSMLNRPDDAIGLIYVMRARGIKPNERTYNALIASCVRVGQLEKARGLFSEMLVDNVRPNAVSWNIIMNWYVRQSKGTQRLNDVLKAFEDMKASGVAPDVASFTTIMKAYARSGLLNKAEEVFSEMKRAMPAQIDATVYNTLLEAYSSRLDWRRCMELYDEMIRSGSETGPYGASFPPDEHYGVNTPIIGSAFDGDDRVPTHSQSFSHRRPWLGASNRKSSGTLESRGIEPNDVTHCLVIRACAKAGQTGRAKNAFDRMMDTGFFPPPNPAVVSLLGGYADAGRLGDCFEVLRSLKTWGVFPDPRMLTAVMNGCLKANRPELALSVYSKFKAARFETDSIVSTLLLRAYGAQGEFEKMFNVVKGMQRNGREARPTVVTYNALIEASLRGGETNLALKALNMLLEARADGININRQTLEVLVFPIVPEADVDAKSSLYLQDKRLNESMGNTNEMLPSPEKRMKYLQDVLTTLRAGGAVPNGILYRGLLLLCQMTSSWDVATKLLEEREQGLFIISTKQKLLVRTVEDQIKGQLAKQRNSERKVRIPYF